MEPVLANASESDSTALSSHLSAHLLSLPLYDLLDHLTFCPDLIINDRLPYSDNLRLESSPHDSDSDYSKIITPYSTDAFHAYLSKAQILNWYPELCFKLSHGFPLRNIADLNMSFTPGNLASATPHDHIIQEYIADELKLGRLSGPFTQKELEAKIGLFRSSPIQVVVKPGEAGGPDKFRCCRNLSYRGNLGFSVNDDINSEEYPTRWGTASECAKIVSTAPPGTQACTLDVEGAYRTVPVSPASKRYLIIEFKGLFYIDHNVPFGLASASGLQGEVADATVDIWHSLRVGPVIKWVDDFNAFRYANKAGLFSGTSDGTVYRYDYDLDYIKAMIAPLGIPWHTTKGSPFGDIFSYVGFEWNLVAKTVYLTKIKREKHLAKVLFVLQDSPLSRQFLKKDIQSLHGSLSHITFVYLRGRAYLNNIIWWLTTFTSDFAPRFPPPSVISDLKWWSIQLSKPSIIRFLAPRPPTSDLNIWVDASTDWGIGLLINDSWDAWRTFPSWKAPGRDIGWLEAVAVELIVTLLNEMHFSHLDVLIRSDNEGVIGAFRKGWSRNQESNSCIRRVEATLEQRDLSISLLYVESSINLADPISRGILPPLEHRVTIPYSIPSSISKYFYHA